MDVACCTLSFARLSHPVFNDTYITRMHSSRMRTACSSSHGGALDLIPLNLPLGVCLDLIPLNFPLGVGLDLIPLNFPLGCGPGPDPPQLPPWVWAWAPAPSPPGADPHPCEQNHTRLYKHNRPATSLAGAKNAIYLNP